MTDIREALKALPHHTNVYGAYAWLDDPHHYPVYAKLFAVLQPKSLLEVGALVGYSMATAVLSAPGLSRVEWVDDESGEPDSNEKAEANVRAAAGDRPLVTYGFRSVDEMEPGAEYDVVHLDARHDYESVAADLRFAATLRPRWIIGHDLNLAGSGVRRAVTEFCEAHSVCFLEFPVTHGGFLIAPRGVEDLKLAAAPFGSAPRTAAPPPPEGPDRLAPYRGRDVGELGLTWVVGEADRSLEATP